MLFHGHFSCLQQRIWNKYHLSDIFETWDRIGGPFLDDRPCPTHPLTLTTFLLKLPFRCNHDKLTALSPTNAQNVPTCASFEDLCSEFCQCFEQIGTESVFQARMPIFLQVDIVRLKLAYFWLSSVPCLSQVDIGWDKMNDGDAFLLDVGKAIYVWNGLSSSLTEKRKVSVVSLITRERWCSSGIVTLQGLGPFGSRVFENARFQSQ